MRGPDLEWSGDNSRGCHSIEIYCTDGFASITLYATDEDHAGTFEWVAACLGALTVGLRSLGGTVEWCSGCSGEEQPEGWEPGMVTYEVTVFDEPLSVGGDRWPSHEDIQVFARDDDHAKELAAEILADAASDQDAETYSVGHVLAARIDCPDGTIMEVHRAANPPDWRTVEWRVWLGEKHARFNTRDEALSAIAKFSRASHRHLSTFALQELMESGATQVAIEHTVIA